MSLRPWGICWFVRQNTVTADQYLSGILDRETVNTGLYSPVRGVQAVLMPSINAWAGQFLRSVNPSGSFAKGTANKSGTDIDLFISLSENTPNTLKEIYVTLLARMRESGYTPKEQNVSVNITVNVRIPVHAGHQFRSMPGHDSGPCRATIPVDAGRGV
jgi:hypothetical protein